MANSNHNIFRMNWILALIPGLLLFLFGFIGSCGYFYYFFLIGLLITLANVIFLIKRKSSRLKISLILIVSLIGLILPCLFKSIAADICMSPAYHKQTIIKVKELDKALKFYLSVCKKLPSTEEGLLLLTKTLYECKAWDPIKESMIKDAWKRDFLYERVTESSYVIRSYGKDGVEGGMGSDKDISSQEL